MHSNFSRSIIRIVSVVLFATVVLASPIPTPSRHQRRDFNEYWTEAKQNATIVTCCVVGGILLLSFGIWWYRRHRRRGREQADHQATQQKAVQMQNELQTLKAEHKKRQNQMKAIFNIE